MCVDNYDEKYYDFHCLPNERLPKNGSIWYTICGTPFEWVVRTNYMQLMRHWNPFFFDLFILEIEWNILLCFRSSRWSCLRYFRQFISRSKIPVLNKSWRPINWNKKSNKTFKCNSLSVLFKIALKQMTGASIKINIYQLRFYQYIFIQEKKFQTKIYKILIVFIFPHRRLLSVCLNNLNYSLYSIIFYVFLFVCLLAYCSEFAPNNSQCKYNLNN